MCRLSAFIGEPICAADLVTRPSRSIIQQSFDARERLAGDASTPGYLNGDGFGLGWYSADPDDRLPCVYRQARPAWNDSNLGMIAQKIYSPLLFAHVRAASPGMDVSESTCHPFRFGQYLWMHNGGLGGFTALRRVLLQKLDSDAFDFAVTNGSSDSALCFAVFLNLIPDKNAPCTPDQMRQRLDETIVILRDAILENNITDLSLLNFVVSDGDSLVVSRFVLDPQNPDAQAASLYYTSGNNYVANKGSPLDYHMVHVDRRATIAIVSSEPLTESRNDWVALPKNHILVVTSSIHILTYRIGDSTASISRTIANHRPCARTSLSVVRNRHKRDKSGTRRAVNCCGSSHPLSRVGLGFPSAARNAAEGLEADSNHQIVLQRAIHTQVDRRHSPVLNANPPRATISPGPSSSPVRYIIQSEEHAILSMTTCDSLLCSGAQDGSIRIWHMQDRTELAVLREHNSAVLALVSDVPTSTLISASSDSHICIWRLTDPNMYSCMLKVSCNGNGDVFSLAIARRYIYAGFSDTVLRRVDKDIDSIVESYMDSVTEVEKGYKSEKLVHSASAVAFPDVSHISMTGTIDAIPGNEAERTSDPDQSALTIANARDPTQGRIESCHFGFIYALTACSNDEFLCSGCGDGMVRIWNLTSNHYHKSLEGHSAAVLVLAVVEQADCNLLWSGSRDGTVRVWDVDREFLCKRAIEAHNDEIVTCVAKSYIVVTGSADGQVHLWNARSLHCIGVLYNPGLRAAAVTLIHELVFLSSSTCKTQACDMAQFDLYGIDKMCADTQVATDATGSSTHGVHGTIKADSNDCVRESDMLPSSDVDAPAKRSSEKTLPKEEAELDLDFGPTELHRRTRVCNGIVKTLSRDPVQRACHDIEHHGICSETFCTLPVASCSDVSLFLGDPRDRCIDTMSGKSWSMPEPERRRMMSERKLENDLRRLISFKSISGIDNHREDCWQTAKYLAVTLEGLNAVVKMVMPSISACADAEKLRSGSKQELQEGSNPIIFAKFESKNPTAPTVVFYGHYDVMPADAKEWNTDPWSLSALDGHFYGRGATDNKGPILAMVYALESLRDEFKDEGLGVHVVMILEGEGEQSNSGLRDALLTHKNLFEGTILILTSNSYWLGEERPCINYGMRGVVDMRVAVSGGNRNLHSGVDGGAIIEPVTDLVGVLSTLVDCHGMAHIPGFYDDIRPLTARDRQRLEEVEYELQEYRNRTGVKKFTSSSATDLLEARWRRPSLSITSLDTSNNDRLHSVMPMEATAKISVRFVPDQEPDKLVRAIKSHLHLEFDKRRSGNELTVTRVGQGDYWLGDPSCQAYQLAERAVKAVWGKSPMYVCEGGTLSIFSFLRKTFNAPIVQVPLGQASDNAHLPNERIRAVNLYRGRDVFRYIIRELSERSVGQSPNLDLGTS